MISMTVICAEIRNYFLKDKANPRSCIFEGEYTISNGVITPSDFLKEGQYFRICGSDLNEGVYCNDETGRNSLVDETFTGSIWAMSVPKDFIALCEQISEWAELNQAPNSANLSALTSESFGGYSYTKGGSSGSKSGVEGAAKTWQTVFYDALSTYRREFVL